jgi:hypothetical protein
LTIEIGYARTAVRRYVTNIPINHATESKGSKPTTALLTMKKTPLFKGTVPALLPRPAEVGEELFGVSVWNAVPIVGDFDRFDSAKAIIVQHHVDAIGVSVNGVPDQLGNRQDRLANLGYRLQVVVLDLNFEGFGGHGAPRRPLRTTADGKMIHTRTNWEPEYRAL